MRVCKPELQLRLIPKVEQSRARARNIATSSVLGLFSEISAFASAISMFPGEACRATKILCYTAERAGDSLTDDLFPGLLQLLAFMARLSSLRREKISADDS